VARSHRGPSQEGKRAEVKWSKFAYTDLDKLSEGRLTDISWEFVRFSSDEIPDPKQA
jgi:hypothetical protein